MADNFLQGVQVGGNLVGSAMDRNMRMQELKSQAALRQLQERQLAQAIEMKMQENARQIQARAAANIAVNRAQWESSPMIMVPNPMGGGPIAAPNPMRKSKGQAIVDNLVPVAAEFGGPDAAAKILQAGALIGLREAQVADELETTRMRSQPRPVLPEQSKLTEARTATEKARQEKLAAETTNIKEGRKGVAPNIQKIIEFGEERGIKFDQDQIQEMIEIDLGAKSKAGTERTLPSRAVWVSQNFAKARENTVGKKVTDDDVVSALEATYDRIAKLKDEKKSQVDTQGLKIGEVRKGYKYNGKFPPSDKQAWDKIQ